LQRKNLSKKSQQNLIEAIYLFNQYHSKACIKGNVRQIAMILRKLNTPTAQRRFLRRQIEMRTKGLGGKFAERFTITWSEAGDLRPIEYLSDHLANIMREEKKMTKFIPKKPPTSLPARRQTHIVGQLTSEVKELDRIYFSDVSKFREDTAKLIEELHERGEGSMYSLMQPFVRPTIWCQGQVTKERKNQEFPTVVVKWDKCEDIKGWERGGVGDQVLKDHLYNKDKKNAWRLDVDADCFKEVGSTDCPEGADEDLRDKCSDSDDEDSCENDSSSEENDSDVDEEDDEEEEEDSED